MYMESAHADRHDGAIDAVIHVSRRPLVPGGRAMSSIGRRQLTGGRCKAKRRLPDGYGAWRDERGAGVPGFFIGVSREFSPPDAVCGAR